ncbi:hypothetical protein T12_11906 [Trichinella patagoniensis]|uniref:Uncharacterized protein n=1 Tax=Trichinella patagoniensis TaxID=990121 RepID=A0A0V1ADC2_9BILA|nr:hypothetical protein T12_11906 [Trichinella patagoniensis]
MNKHLILTLWASKEYCAYSQPDVATTSHSVESSHDYDCLRSLNLACNAVSLDELKELNQLAAVAKSPSYLEWVHERQTLRMQTRSEWFLSPIITTGEKINGGFCSRSIDAAMNKALLARRNSRNRSDLARRRSFRTHHVPFTSTFYINNEMLLGWLHRQCHGNGNGDGNGIQIPISLVETIVSVFYGVHFHTALSMTGLYRMSACWLQLRCI